MSKIDKQSFHYAKKVVLTLQSEGYLKHNSKNYRRSYSLKQVGRWFAICILLDHISFQSLCILADAYSKIKNHTRYYLVSKFRDNFDKSHDEDQRSCVTAIYSHRNISLSIKMLTDRNLVYWAFDDILKISPGIFEKLQKYDQDLESLARWNYEISEKCRDEYLKTITFDQKKRKFLSLTSKC